MFIYIDFDSTIFHTKNFFNYTCLMIANECAKFCAVNDNGKFLNEIQDLYKTSHIKNVSDFCEKLEERFQIKKGKIKKVIEKSLLNANKFVFSDVIPFLKKMKGLGHTLILFTYSEKSGFEYQLSKLKYSGVANFFDDILITCGDKSKLDLDYENGVFIDDNPEVLKGLVENNSKRVIRICREGCKYSNCVIDLDIEKVSSLSEILM